MHAAMLKMTKQRRVVLDAVRRAKGHPDAAQVYKAAQLEIPNISLGTVYRTLEALAAARLIGKVESAGSRMRFDSKAASHWHVQCLSCGTVVDSEALSLDSAVEAVSGATGFEITGQKVEFAGVCPSCRRKGGGARARGRGKPK